MSNNAPLQLLYLFVATVESTSPYYEHALPLSKRHNITICTYYAPQVSLPDNITVVSGNGSIFRFIFELFHILKSKDFDVIHAHWAHVGFLLVFVSLFSSRTTLKKAIYTVHSSYKNYKFRNKLLHIPIFLWFKSIVFCSQSSYSSFPSWFRGLIRGNVSVIPNGVDIHQIDETFEAIDDSHQDTNKTKFIVIAIGRLVKVKNHDVIIRALAEIADPHIELHIVGAGPLQKELIELANSAPVLNSVIFWGAVPRQSVYRMLRDADLFVSMSHVEGLPIAVLEAMACYCPVLLSDIPSHREIVENEVNPLTVLVSSSDVQHLRDEVLRILATDTALLNNNRETNRHIVEKWFNIDRMLSDYENIYYVLRSFSR